MSLKISKHLTSINRAVDLHHVTIIEAKTGIGKTLGIPEARIGLLLSLPSSSLPSSLPSSPSLIINSLPKRYVMGSSKNKQQTIHQTTTKIKANVNVKRIFVTQPSNAAVWSNSSFQKKRLPHIKIGHAADGERHYSDDDQIVYCTIGHLKKRLLNLVKRSSITSENKKNEIIVKQKIHFCEEIMIDEVHNGNADNRVVMELLKKYFDIKVILVTATLSLNLLEEYNLKTKYIESLKTIDEKQEVELFFSSDDKQSCVYSVKEERNFPLEIIFNDNYCDAMDKGIYDETIKVILKEHQRNTPGHYLIFAPGQAEITGLINTLYDYEEFEDCLILPAYGELGDELKKIFEVSEKRKIIVSTNIMESSITIDGIGLVVNIPLERLVEASSTQRSVLVCKSISKASMTQREGRAGRTMPGKVIHMCNQDFYNQLLENREEEIKRIPIYNIILELLDVNILPQFLLNIEQHQYETSIKTLKKLKTIDDEEKVTDVGHFCPDFPLSIYASTVLFKAVKAKLNIYPIVSLLSLIECNGPSYMFIPRRKQGIQSKTDEPEIIKDIHDKFRGKSDLHTMLNIYHRMVSQCRGLFQHESYYTAWCRKYSMNNKKLLEVRQLIKRILSVCEQKSIPYKVVPIDIQTTILDVSPILIDVYSENVLINNKDGYTDEQGKEYKISDRMVFCKESIYEYQQLLTLNVFEIANKKYGSGMYYAGCLLPIHTFEDFHGSIKHHNLRHALRLINDGVEQFHFRSHHQRSPYDLAERYGLHQLVNRMKCRKRMVQILLSRKMAKALTDNYVLRYLFGDERKQIA
jgi:hypothetical protein